MPNKIAEGDKVFIKAGDEKGSWGIVKLISGDEYHVGVAGEDMARTYDRKELTLPRKPVVSDPVAGSDVVQIGKDPESTSRAVGQLDVIKFDMVRVRSINDERTFLEVTYKGTNTLISIEGLTYGTVADYVAKNKPEED